MCLVIHQTTFTMPHYSPTDMAKFSLRTFALTCSFLLFLPLSYGQEWRIEPCCNPGNAFRQGAVEMTLGPAALYDEYGEMTARPMASLAVFKRQRGPFKRGIRMGVVGLGSTSETVEIENGQSIQYREFLPELSGVLRFDPFRGGFQPFAEGELGLAASVMDERTFDAQGNRTDHSVSGFDSGLFYGWGAGARVRMGRSSFVMLRYGSRIGSPLDLFDEGDPTQIVEPHRQDVSLGLSLAF